MLNFKKFLLLSIFLILSIKIAQPIQKIRIIPSIKIPPIQDVKIIRKDEIIYTFNLKGIAPSLRNLFLEAIELSDNETESATLIFNVHEDTDIDHEAIINSTGTDLVARAITKVTERESSKNFLEDFIKNKKNKIIKKLEKKRSKKLNESHLSYYLSTGKSCLKSPPFSGWQPLFPDIYYKNEKNKRYSKKWYYPFFYSRNDAIPSWISYEKREYNFSNKPALSEYLHLLSCKSPMNYNITCKKFVLALTNHLSKFI